MDKIHCLGCNDDFYNGKNPMGIPECWLLKDAVLASRRRVGINDRPPWERTPAELPNCYRQKGFIFIGANRTGWET